ncbi:hypothetical protein PG989_015730 [Apiospora arundinis]
MSVNITRTSVLEDGTLPFPTRGPKTIPIPVETEAKFAKNALRGLNLLQTRYDEPINSRSLSSSLEYLYDHLPGKVQGLMTWLSPDDFEMFPDEVDNFDTEGYREYLEKHRRFFDSTYESIRKHEYYIQQVNTKDDHFVTVILHLTKDDPENAGKNDPFTAVDWSAYVDPATGRHISERRVANVRARIAEFLRPALANIEDRQSHERELWVPRARPADLDWSSGLRAYVLFEQLTRRLVDLFCEGRTYCPDAMWKPTCAWTNLEKARDDMVCAAAHQHGKEDPAALVRSKLYTPVEIGQYIDDGSDIDDDEESSHLSPSSSDSEDSDEEEEVHMQNVDKVLIDLVGGDEDDDDEENEEEKEEERCQQQSQKQQQESTPLPSKVSSPEPEDVEMTDYDHNSNTQDQKESLVIALEGHEEEAKVAVEDEKEGGVGSDDVMDTPVFFGSQWPHEIPCPPSAAARYLANRLDLQPPQQDITTPNPSVGADFFEVNVEMPTVGGNEEEEVQVQSPSSDVKPTVETTSNNEEPQSQQYSTPSSGADGEDRDEFSRSDAPSPESQRQPEAAMDFLSPSPSESLVVVDVESEVPLTPIPSPVAGPVLSRPASPMEKSAKRKLSHTTEEDEAPGPVVPEYDPALPILGGLRESQVDPPTAAATAAISRWTAASPTGGQIPGLTLAHEPDAAPAETSVLETRAEAAQREDGEKVEETEQSSAGEPPSYIA